jgi:hypothetical protein
VALSGFLPDSTTERFDSSPDDFKIGIALMVTTQPDFQRWLNHYLNVIRVDRIYLRIENAPDIVKLAQQYPDKIHFEIGDSSKEKKNNYTTLIDRQRDFISAILPKARQDGMDVLFHVDADEWIKVRSATEDIRTILKNVPSDIACIHFKNFEAVYGDSSSDSLSGEKCFSASGFLDCKTGSCRSYANGKSAAVLKNDPKFHGPHYFTGKVYEMPDDNIVILHFDSCSYTAWRYKFKRLKNSDLTKVPFPFYRESIELMNTDPDEAKMREFYLRRQQAPEGSRPLQIEHFGPVGFNF